MVTLKTKRLLLLPLGLEDAPAVQATFPVWEIVRWMNGTVPWPYPADGAMTYISQVVLPAVDAGTAWHWSIRPKIEPDRLIGVISLMDQVDDNRGFWLDPGWQGRGLMTEASDAVTDYWFNVLGKTVLRVPKAVDNPASRRLSEKRGMKVVQRFRASLVSGLHDAELWEIDQDTWRQIRRSGNLIGKGE